MEALPISSLRRARSFASASAHSATHLSGSLAALQFAENSADHVLRMRPLVLVLVGLPARGKSYITRKLRRYLNWVGFRTREFNAGERRRRMLGQGQDADFFASSNSSATSIRDRIALDTLDELLEWLRSGQGYVGVFDATNTTRARRAQVIEHVKAAGNFEVVFVESICTDPVILEKNYRMKLCNDDYKGMDPAAALEDFKARVRKYEEVYEPLAEDDFSYIKLYNVGDKVVINRCHGYLIGQISSCLTSMHIESRTIWICRHGESADNAAGKLGGDSLLTPRGSEFAVRLGEYIAGQAPKDLLVWTSTLLRTKATSVAVNVEGSCCVSTALLSEIDAGICEGLTYAEVKRMYPDIHVERQANKLCYRYPGGGESYLDVIERVKPLILELERLRGPVLIICHQAVARTLLAYFTDVHLDDMVDLPVDLHSLYELTPAPYGCDVKKIHLGPDVSVTTGPATSPDHDSGPTTGELAGDFSGTDFYAGGAGVYGLTLEGDGPVVPEMP